MASKLNLGAGDHPIEGYTNLDRKTGWVAEEDGLSYEFDSSVDGITISHMLMYVAEEHWPDLFDEFYRVLIPGGIVRITEDATDDPNSERFGGNPNDPDLKTLTTVGKVMYHLMNSGFTPFSVAASYSLSRDWRMCQTWHGMPPKVFFVEGVK